MLVYHGTTAAIARDALQYGLSPRSDSGVESNWDTCPSNPDLVYLTTAYAPYFAASATKKDERWGIVEIDTDLLNPSALLPDEDFLEQVTRKQSGKGFAPVNQSMQKRTKWYRDRLGQYAHHWEDSITGLGNAAYRGEVPPEAVTRVAIYDPRSNAGVTITSLDPSISVMNYHIMESKYRALTSWFMGEEINLQDFLGFFYAMLPLEQVEQYREQFANQSGLEVIEAL